MKEPIDNMEFSQRLQQAFQDKARAATLKKCHILTAEGEIEDHLYFIADGAVKINYLSELGEKIIRLGYNGSILNSLSSFFNRKPSDLFLETIRETKLKILKREEVLAIAKNSKGYSDFLEAVLVQQLDRELDLLIDSPRHRLERVLKRSPDLFQHVPLKYIASYLRMSPETLSRIRNS